MIKMQEKQEMILSYSREGKSKKRIARELGINVKTVRRYLREYEKKRMLMEESPNKEEEGLLSLMVVPSKYDSSGRQKRQLTKEVQEQIDSYLLENARKAKQGRHKQMMKKIDIHEALKKAGYAIGYTTVCNYIRIEQQLEKQAYIRQHYEAGGVCEFDWGEVKLTIGGLNRIYQMAVFTSAYGNYRWSQLYERQDTMSFQQAHVDFFAHIGGVYYQLVYDNTRVVIRRFVGRYEKEATEGLMSLSMYYQFQYRFCNVNSGHEKGHVERSVEYVRRKAFSHKDVFESREQANSYLLQRCGELNGIVPRGKEKNPLALLEEEKGYLHVCPPIAFECAQLRSLRVDKYATINLSGNHYSVAEELVGQIVDVKVYALKLVVYYQKKEICCHSRQYCANGWYIHLEHYLKTLSRKPGALAASLALRQADEGLKNLFHNYFTERPKDFIELLHYKRDHGISLKKLEEAIDYISRLTPTDVSLDKIKVMCERQPIVQQEVLQDGAIAHYAQAQLKELTQLLLQSNYSTVEKSI